jgi:hypothetical protein
MTENMAPSAEALSVQTKDFDKDTAFPVILDWHNCQLGDTSATLTPDVLYYHQM